MITIIDYGVGNLRSVEKAIEYVGGEVKITADPKEILEAEAVILPGVGAFEEAMAKLSEAGLTEVVKQAVLSGKPFLGICLGMQLLFDYSEEGTGKVMGLGIFKGGIKRFPSDMGLKIPHMGWNTLSSCTKTGIFNGIAEGEHFYFVHSYYLDSSDRELVVARSQYGIEFDAAISKGKLFATQFHPEKSGRAGLALLKNFVALSK
jgi:glutamine amidotransferase